MYVCVHVCPCICLHLLFVPYVVGCVWQPQINKYDDDDDDDDACLFVTSRNCMLASCVCPFVCLSVPAPIWSSANFSQHVARALVIISAVCLARKEKLQYFILVPASVRGIATLQCSSSARHLQSPRRSGPIAIAALFSLLLTLGNYMYTPKGIKNNNNRHQFNS